MAHVESDTGMQRWLARKFEERNLEALNEERSTKFQGRNEEKLSLPILGLVGLHYLRFEFRTWNFVLHSRLRISFFEFAKPASQNELAQIIILHHRRHSLFHIFPRDLDFLLQRVGGFEADGFEHALENGVE